MGKRDRTPKRNGALRPGSWRSRARARIRAAIADLTELHGDPAELFRVINKEHYPFGSRSMLPYKAWRIEIRFAREAFAIAQREFGNAALPQECGCDACGAWPGQPCRPIGDHDPLILITQVADDAEAANRPLEAMRIRQQAFHQARLSRAKAEPITPPTSGPLFGDP